MMQEIRGLIRRQFGCEPECLQKVANVPNNSVYTFSIGGKRYIFKFYKSKYWPEDGKIPFVNRILREHSIPCAELVTFSREDEKYPAGYLMEQEIAGYAADKTTLTREEETELYKKLAEYVSEVHRIPLPGFGYIGGGEPDYGSMCEFFDDEFDDRTEMLIEQEYFTAEEIAKLKTRFMETVRRFADLPAVLCHGDLSTKNILVQEDGTLVLIDWDDAIAYCWMADIARFTFWMRLNYGVQDAAHFRKTFLESYRTDFRKEDFPAFEEAFHVYIALDFLAYYVKTGDQERILRMKEYLAQRIA